MLLGIRLVAFTPFGALAAASLMLPEVPSQEPSLDGPQTHAAHTVAGILREHDRSLLRSLRSYIAQNQHANDLDQAYLALFETAVRNDWFEDAEALALGYLKEFPEGAVSQMARIVATMSHLRAGRFDDAHTTFKSLMNRLDGEEQLAFAASFCENFTEEALGRGQHTLAAKAQKLLLDKFGANAELRADVERVLERIEMIGSPAPPFRANDLSGREQSLVSLRGKVVLIDFWATWAEPCQIDRPILRSLYQAAHDRGLEILSISLDTENQDVVTTARQLELSWPQLSQADSGIDFVELFKVGKIPATILIDRNGVIRRLDARGANLRPAVEPLLMEPASEL